MIDYLIICLSIGLFTWVYDIIVRKLWDFLDIHTIYDEDM
jgi:hypothetical protein